MQAGFTHIDCAEMYGTEAVVGQALHEWVKKTTTPRPSLFVTSKVYRGATDVLAACKVLQPVPAACTAPAFLLGHELAAAAASASAVAVAAAAAAAASSVALQTLSAP